MMADSDRDGAVFDQGKQQVDQQVNVVGDAHIHLSKAERGEVGLALEQPDVYEEVRRGYMDALVQQHRLLRMHGIAPRVGGRELSLPLAKVFIPLRAAEGRPTLSRYAEEYLQRQVMDEVRREFDGQRR